jgi:methylated-DNA-[protein]-cysteine S-methyltransferase
MNLLTTVPTELGTLALAWNERGLARVLLPRADWGEIAPSELAKVGLRGELRPPRAIADLARALQRHLRGEPQDFSGVALDTDGSPPFLLRVQRAAQMIPPGQTRTYGELAGRAGSPRAVRAVGRAMATNPWPIVVPCHRVFARSGFGEYSAGSGVPTKLRLLWREGYRGRTSNVMFDEREAIAHLRGTDPRLRKLIDHAGPFTLQAAAPRALRSLADEEIIARLTRTRGIGRWNAQMLLMFYLGRPNVLPASDPLLRKGFAITYGTRGLPGAKTIADAARGWSPYASVASWYLWRAVEIERYRAAAPSA